MQKTIRIAGQLIPAECLGIMWNSIANRIRHVRGRSSFWLKSREPCMRVPRTTRMTPTVDVFETISFGGHHRQNIIYRCLHDVVSWKWMYPDPPDYRPPRRTAQEKLMLVMRIMTTCKHFHAMNAGKLLDVGLTELRFLRGRRRSRKQKANMKSYRHCINPLFLVAQSNLERL